MAIDTQHPEYVAMAETWRTVTEICDGKDVLHYIQMLNPLDRSQQNRTLNDTYRNRAVFLEIAGYSSRGMVGLLFKKPPALKIPPALEYIEDNIDGNSVSLYQQAQTVAKHVVRNGRAGLWVDFPNVSGALSLADMDDGRIIATVEPFTTSQIINWAVKQDGAKTKLSLVVLRDSQYQLGADYAMEQVSVILELFLDDADTYTVRKWQQIGMTGWQVVDEYQPRDASGNLWREIPFQFCGAESNTHLIDNPPMLGIVRQNIGHYNNSATYENSVHYCGQPQPYMSGLSMTQAQEMQAAGFYWGAGVLLPVPEGGTVGIVQAGPNVMAREAMLDKVAAAIGMGAMFIQPGSAVKTATQAAGEMQVQHSVLSLIAANIGEAYEQCLAWMARYMGTEDSAEFQLSTDFVDPQATAQDLQAVVASWTQGALPFSDLWTWAQKTGFADPEKTAEEAQEEIGAATSQMPDLEAEEPARVADDEDQAKAEEDKAKAEAEAEAE